MLSCVSNVISMRIFMLLLLCGPFLPSVLQAQRITAGPVLGSVTDSSARVFIQTDAVASIRLEVSPDSSFSNPILFNGNTSTGSYLTAVMDLRGLAADTRYFYCFVVNGQLDTLSGRFRTFPPVGTVGNYRVVVGSCNYHNFYLGGGATSVDNYYNDVLFGSILNFDPHVVLHLGDWNFPPTAYNWNYNLFDSLRAASFALRYIDYNFSRYILPNLPVDYVYDDDFSQNGTAGWTYPTFSVNNGVYTLRDEPLPPGIREGAIEGYFDYFPAYPQVDSSGVHHSFRLGNIEFFVVDTRNSKDPVHEIFQFNSLLNIYTVNFPSPHSTLGPAQRQWLLDGLRNSTADWKVICSSVVFNQNLGPLLNLLAPAQLVDRRVVELMASIAYMWPGYPEDSDALLDLIDQEGIKNVVMLSGDTHSSMIDDGTNAGLPELSASGWAAGNEAYLNQTIDSVINLFNLGLPTVGDFLWNGGGSGIGNNSRNDTYARMEFFGTDSLRMCVVDEFDQTLACLTLLYDNGSATGSNIWKPNHDLLLLYPNPAKDVIRLKLGGLFEKEEVTVMILDGSGRVVLTQSGLGDGELLSLRSLARGTYLLRVEGQGGEVISRRFVRH